MKSKVPSSKNHHIRDRRAISFNQLASFLFHGSALSVLSPHHNPLLIPKFLRRYSQSRFRATSFSGFLLSRKFPDFRATALQPPTWLWIAIRICSCSLHTNNHCTVFRIFGIYRTEHYDLLQIIIIYIKFIMLTDVYIYYFLGFKN